MSGLLVALFAGSFYVTMRVVFAGREVLVPDLAGLVVDEARATLNRSELYLETAAERFDERVPKGRVQSQDPPAGATIKKNRKVRVTVSLGPLEIAIPDLTGQTLRTAQLTLQRAGLSVGHITSMRTEAPADVVVAQHPLASGPGGGSADVDLLVRRGSGEPIYVMPDLTGRRLDQISAFVKKAGLRLGAVRREKVPGAPRGAVIKQYPEAGFPVGRQEIISLVLSE
jgi:serine/threonine-protein kinase